MGDGEQLVFNLSENEAENEMEALIREGRVTRETGVMTFKNESELKHIFGDSWSEYAGLGVRETVDALERKVKLIHLSVKEIELFMEYVEKRIYGGA